MELHYRINASILKYLELHEGKDISNTMGDFFKKCLDYSKFLKKMIVPKPPEPTPKEIIEQPPTKTQELIASAGFQEQFLNSLNKFGSDNVDMGVKGDNNNIDKLIKEGENNLEKEVKESAMEDNVPKISEKLNDDSDDIQVIKESNSENFITISDSEDERDKSKGIKNNFGNSKLIKL